MQEEVTQKTIALVFKSSRLTADVLKKAMKLYLEHRKAGKQATHGKMSVKKLVGQGMGASSIEVTDNNIKSFERVARKYNVDFAVKKDKTVEPPKYMVFFKGKDADVITQAFKEFVKVNEKKRGRVSVREKLAARASPQLPPPLIGRGRKSQTSLTGKSTTTPARAVSSIRRFYSPPKPPPHTKTAPFYGTRLRKSRKQKTPSLQENLNLPCPAN